LADFTLFVILGLTELGIAAVIAFVRINGQPFHYFLLNVIQTLTKPRRRIWDKSLNNAELREIIKAPPPAAPPRKFVKEKVATRKLSELTLVVNTGGVYNPED
jgi:hypothetical protein